jgi:hypothetical protein
MKLVEVCITEPAKITFGDLPKLDGIFDHPARLRYSHWWLNDDGSVTMVGGEGKFIPDNRGNFDYMGNHAHVVCEIAERRHKEGDRFVEITE